MSGSDDNLPLLTPRTQALISSLLGEDLPAGNENEVPSPVPEKQNPCLDSTDIRGSGVVTKDLDVPKPGLRGGLTERIAARSGFNAPKLNTTDIRSASVGSSQGTEPHRISLSPGFSPSAFLDSPVFLINSLAQPSPTTGKFPLGQCNNTSSLPAPGLTDKDNGLLFMNADVEPFALKPHSQTNSPYLSSTANKIDPAFAQQQPKASTEASFQPDFSDQSGRLDVNPEKQQVDLSITGSSDTAERKDSSVDFTFDQKLSNSAIANENSPPIDQFQGDEQKEEFASIPLGQPSEDGYNWRKYGQKQVKGSEFPRSYYKCTHQNCPVKKKVERSPEGLITEIIYRGSHNHSMPSMNHRATVMPANPFGGMMNNALERNDGQPTMDRRPAWANMLNGTVNTECRINGVDVTSSAPMPANLCDPSVSTQDVPHFESSDAVDISSTPSNEEEEDGTTHGIGSFGDDGEDEEPELKQRKLESSVVDMSSASRSVREPRVVVQTTSEVDILDDGYRWRKYGQKVVKGNPNPRSYYKCTSVGCTVRKHVERASHDPKAVITTYEGKHDHDVPATRSSNHSTPGPSGSASQSHNANRRSETSHSQENFPRFDTTSLGNFSMPPGRAQLGPSTTFSFGLGSPSLTSFAMVGLVPTAPMMIPQAQAYLGQQSMNELGFVNPKGEPMEEPMNEPESSFNISSGKSVYQQIMGRLPLGP